MNRRKRSAAITADQAGEMVNAYAHAELIGRPLVWMLSIRLPVDDLDAVARCEAFAAARKRVAIAFTRAKVPLFAIWAREVSRRDRIEHLHILAYAPAEARPSIVTRLRSWWPAHDAVDAKPMPMRAHVGRNGKLRAGPGYLLKVANAEASAATGFNRVPSGGDLIGKRCGATLNLAAKAIAAFHAARPSAQIFCFTAKHPSSQERQAA